MKGIFIIFESLAEYNGISKKISAQVRGFKNNNVPTKLTSLIDDTKIKSNYLCRIVDGQIIETYSKNRFLNRIQRVASFKRLYDYINTNEINFVYIRYVHTANPFFINFLRKIKDRDIKILIEIPTYPYDDEYKNASLKQKMFLIIEKLYRKKFKHYVDYIITVQNYNSILGVNTIKIGNGIDISTIPFIKSSNCLDSINLIGVASLNLAHGFDRIIQGLSKYYALSPSKNVYFHIVGNSNTTEAMKYKQLAVKYNLTNYVIFHGRKYGNELNSLFSISDIGIGCLGNHRKGIFEARSLKNREYCARGIPFIYSERDEDFDDKPFIFKAPADETPINIINVVEFLNKNLFDKNQMRDYAERYLTWDYQIEKLINQADIK